MNNISKTEVKGYLKNILMYHPSLILTWKRTYKDKICFMPLAWKMQWHLVFGPSGVWQYLHVPRINLSLMSPCFYLNWSYLMFGLWYSYQYWTLNSSKGYSHFTYVTFPLCSKSYFMLLNFFLFMNFVAK